MHGQISDSYSEDYDIGADYYEKGDYANAFHYFLNAANSGDLNAQNDVGSMYKDGEGTTKNYIKAFEWYAKAAEKGHKYAQNNLGNLYYEGKGVKQSYLKAYEWYKKSAEQGYAKAQYMLGYMFFEGEGLKKDYLKAYEWCSKAAEQGHAKSQNLLGIMFDEGKGVKKDHLKAYEWYSKAAEQGYAEAQFDLATLYYSGYGVNQDYMKAYELFIKAAEQGETSSCNYLGHMFDKGLGVSQDYTKAFEWYSKAAKEGNKQAQNNIGDLYYYGNGVKQDFIKAFEWYKKAAEQGYAEAQNNIGFLYEEGYGVKKDKNKAYTWYLKAANNGYAEAQMSLGSLYEEGEGVTKDYQKAISYYTKATENGNDVAPYRLGLMYLKGKGITKDYNKSEEWFKKSIENRSENPYSYSYLAVIYALRDNNYDKAIEYSDIALKKEWLDRMDSENKSTIYGLRGQIYYLKGDMINAEKMLSKCIELTPNYLSANEEFAKIMSNRKGIGIANRQNYITQEINKNAFAIIIGNEIYKNEVDVPYAHNDAKVFCEYVEKTLGVPHDQVRLIENAGYNDIRIAINWLTQAMKVCRGKGKAIVYYAGHGIPNEADMSAYLLPADGIGNDPGSAYALKELYEKLGSVEAQSITIFLDACFSGSKREEGMLTSARGVAIKTKSATPKGNIIVFSAAQGDETAYPYKDMQHGMFTYYLLKKLQDSKGEVTLGELGDYLIDEVGRESFVKNGKMQTPTVIVAPSLQNSWKNLKLK